MGRVALPTEESLDDFFDRVLKKKFQSDVEVFESAKAAVKEAVTKDMCFDKQTLMDCWDELKDSIPGVPRSIIGEALMQEKYESVHSAPKVSCTNWLYALGITSAGMILPSVVACFKDRDAESEETVWRHFYEVWLPLAVVFTTEMIVCSYLGPRVGYDMIQQRSCSVNLRDAMRNNMTNQAIIGALLLTVVWAMAQGDPPITEGTDSFEAYFVSQWYQGFVVSAVGQLLVAVMVCCFNLMYIEPLDDVASLKFVKDNFSYFGEPMALMLAALYNAVCATILWVFGAYGFGMGVCFSLVIAYSFLRGTVVYVYLGLWKNPYLTQDELDQRKKEAEVMVTANGDNFPSHGPRAEPMGHQQLNDEVEKDKNTTMA